MLAWLDVTRQKLIRVKRCHITHAVWLPSVRPKHSVLPVQSICCVAAECAAEALGTTCAVYIEVALHPGFFMHAEIENELIYPCTQSSTTAIVTCSLLCVIRTASDDSCGGELGTRLRLIWRIVRAGGCLVIVALGLPGDCSSHWQLNPEALGLFSSNCCL